MTTYWDELLYHMLPFGHANTTKLDSMEMGHQNREIKKSVISTYGAGMISGPQQPQEAYLVSTAQRSRERGDERRGRHVS